MKITLLLRLAAMWFVLLSVLVCCSPEATAFAQPGPLQSLSVSLPAGTVAVPVYTPFAMSYYPYHNGVLNDSVKYLLTNQLVEGTSSTADRILNVSTGTYAYRAIGGTWTGSLTKVLNKYAHMILNRHGARAITLEGYPADSVTYIFPMPNGTHRFVGPRMLRDHGIDSVGFIYSGFHKSGNMRQGGDIILDMTTRQICRRDSSGWIGTMTHLRVGQPILVQVNHPLTFDWTYYPGRE